jgi:outer membrane protein insertion porin family
LENGLLTVRFRELRIAAFDTVALGIDASGLSLAVGDLFNYDRLLEDVRRLAVGRSADVRIETLATATGAVRVRFVVGPPDTAGPVREVVIEGNTRLSDEALLALFGMGVGDTFTSLLAEEDFRRIRAAYDTLGVVIEGRPAFQYRDGVYVQRITELRITGYELVYDGDTGRTQERVITRYLPAVGEVVDLRAVDNGLRQVARLGVVTPVNRILVPTGEPGEVIIEVRLRANATGLLQPGAQYSTATGLSGNVSYAESNLWGLAHNVSAELSVVNSDLGLQVGAGVRYAVPWLDVDLLDFREVPTSISVAFFTTVDINQPLSADGRFTVAYPGLDPDVEENQVRVGEYLIRSTGASFSVGRRVLPFTDLILSGRATFDAYRLEPVQEACEVEAGVVTNPTACALPEEEAAGFLPQGGLNAFVSAGLGFDNRDSIDFPREGIAANVSFGYGWGNDMADPASGGTMSYAYTQTQAGVRTYLALADVVEGMEDRNHVFAVRLNVGAQFGAAYPENRRFRVGSVQNTATEIRGYRDTDFDPTRSYVTSSVEYRYDFGLDTFATETVVAIVFVDLGYVPSLQASNPDASPLAASAGAGVQLNLGFAGVALPALRFDYGFSPRNPTGVFSFRVGSVF